MNRFDPWSRSGTRLRAVFGGRICRSIDPPLGTPGRSSMIGEAITKKWCFEVSEQWTLDFLKYAQSEGIDATGWRVAIAGGFEEIATTGILRPILVNDDAGQACGLNADPDIMTLS